MAKTENCSRGSPAIRDLQFETKEQAFNALPLLDYKGPFIDYSARPTVGNFPLSFLSHTSKYLARTAN